MFARLVSSLAFVCLAACGTGSRPCGPGTCDGCCTAAGTCSLGTGADACGLGGAMCSSCASGHSCQTGACFASQSTGGGTAGGSGGGSAGGSGGGSAGGTGGGSAGGSGGGGAAPAGIALEVDRSSLRFGQEFGSATWLGTSPQESLVVRSKGQQALTLGAATLSGADVAAFSVAQPSAAPLSTGASTVVRVIFAPTQPRLYSATLTLASDAVSAPTVIQLSGQGVGVGGGVNPGNPECLGSSCGAPPEANGGCGSGSAWQLYTDDGATLAYTDDADGDGVADDHDNCPFASNEDQLDGDGDGVGTACDNCAGTSNFAQLDTDGDAQGDLCDADLDGDAITNATDNCPHTPNASQLNADTDQEGDACDPNEDGDAFDDIVDVCPGLASATNVSQGDPACSADTDLDFVSDANDNCSQVANGTQADTDLDGRGDACDLDVDNDSVLNASDNCRSVVNRDQRDDDGDGLGDACDPKYCVVVDPSAPDDCLDPQHPFRVSGGAALTVPKQTDVRLPLFANRNGAGIEYTWLVTSRPTASTASISHNRGTAGLSRHWEYAYLDGANPSFRPDAEGTYTLQLQGHLVIPDRAYPTMNDSVATLTIHATP